MTSNRIWVIGASLLILVVLLLGYFLGVVPKLNEAAASAEQQAQVDAQNQQSEAILSTLAGQYKNLDELSAKLAALQVQMPSSPDGSTFADELSAAADAAHVSIKSITLGEAAPFGTPAGAAAPAPAPTSTPAPVSTGAPTQAAPTTQAAPEPGQLYTISVAIVLNGLPDQIADFTSRVQSGGRYFFALELNFQEATGGSTSSTSTAANSDGTTTKTTVKTGGSSSNTGTLSGTIYVVTGTTVAGAEPTPTPTPIPTGTSTPIPTPTGTPKP